MSAVDRGATLVRIAREAIVHDAQPSIEAAEPWLREPGASFVTLKLDGELRGCIGSVEPHRPLAVDVAHNARAAAFNDPRFAPVSAAEIPRLGVEVSVLSPRVPFEAASESDALAKLRPQVDGLYLEFGAMRATFLPQVWESLPDPADFLGELRRKAGLPPGFWHPGIRLSRYTVEKYR
jgi:AmmeMemoRadiSam system protein A